MLDLLFGHFSKQVATIYMCQNKAGDGADEK